MALRQSKGQWFSYLPRNRKTAGMEVSGSNQLVCVWGSNRLQGLEHRPILKTEQQTSFLNGKVIKLLHGVWDFEVRRPVFKHQLSHLLAMRPWAFSPL